MLVLSRRQNQRIMINDNIVITVAGINQGSVSIGIDAPKDYTIHREEIYNKENNRKTEEFPLLDDLRNKTANELSSSILSKIQNLLDGVR